jgi:hypothetical protein
MTGKRWQPHRGPHIVGHVLDHVLLVGLTALHVDLRPTSVRGSSAGRLVSR